MPKEPAFTAIQAGAALYPRLNMLGDDSGDTISDRNSVYSELTAYYWIYKNAPRTADALGICHYRRYFIDTKYRYFIWPRPYYYIPTSQELLDKLLSPKQLMNISRLLDTHDIIVPHAAFVYRKNRKAYTVDEGYAINHIGSDWELTKKIVLAKYPDYARSLALLGKQTKLFFNNVMIAPWPVWDAYFDWLFDILFAVEKELPLPREGYQARVLGFLAERLHNLYILQQGYHCASLTQAIFQK